MTIIGVDPGATGGIVVVRDGKLVAAAAIPYLKYSVKRVWMDGGKHEKRFTSGLVDSDVLALWLSRLPDPLVVYIEEPGATHSGKGHHGADASINRAFQGIAQTLSDVTSCPIYAVAANHWPRFVFRNVPTAWNGGDFALRQAKAKGKRPTTPDKKDRARLACLMEWGRDATSIMRKSPTSQIDSGMADAGCVAIFGMLHQGQAPHIYTQSMRSLMDSAGVV